MRRVSDSLLGPDAPTKVTRGDDAKADCKTRRSAIPAKDRKAWEMYQALSGSRTNELSLSTLVRFARERVSVLRSAKTIRPLTDAILRTAKCLGARALSEGDSLTLKRVLADLARRYPLEIRRVHPLQQMHIAKLGKLCSDIEDRGALCHALRQTLLLWALGHDGLLRSGEICSHLQVKDFQWFPPNKVMLTLERDKTSKGRPRSIPLMYYGVYSAYHVLERSLRDRGIEDDPEALVFPCLRRDRRTGAYLPQLAKGLSLNTRACRKLIKMACTAIGLDECKYSGHSLRAGGCTDLFERGVDPLHIKRMGRWSSDCYEIYCRDLQQRTMEREVASAWRLG